MVTIFLNSKAGDTLARLRALISFKLIPLRVQVTNFDGVESMFLFHIHYNNYIKYVIKKICYFDLILSAMT